MGNLLQKAISEKGSAVGTFLGVSTPPVLEAISGTGLDFVVIDCEHGFYDMLPMSDMIRSAESKGIAPVVRVADLTHGAMQHALDSGAQGVIIPCLRSVEEFRQAVELAKFAPLGNRGFIKGRGSGFGTADWAAGSLSDYMNESNERALLLPQCETAEALAHIEEIAAIGGIDGIFIGPFDLSICMGIPAQFEHPDFHAAMKRILSACQNAGKLCLTFTMSGEEARAYLAAGFDAVAIGLDTAVFHEAYRQTVAAVRR